MNRRVRSAARLRERFIVGRDELDAISEGVGGKGAIAASNGIRIAPHFEACDRQRFEKLCEICDQKCRMSFLGWAKVSFNPEVQLQDGPEKREYVAREVHGEEKAEWWERAVQAWPDYAEYQKKTEREIPVFVLEPR